MATFSSPAEMVGSVFVIRPTGYLDEAGGKTLRAAFQEPLQKGCQKFLLNLTGTPVINSQGITQILEICEAVLYEQKGTLGLVGLSELYTDVFEVVGILNLVTLFADEAEALKLL
ncbi:MAG TPA: STAS domain-containing protein [Candidatus Ozemobacteraceae bacterium]|nr:STAS domain-containing protein [Candidatus Ozemobacteraceae bacterium]